MAGLPKTKEIYEEEVYDTLAFAVARALTCANKKAKEYDLNVTQSLVSITQEIQKGKDMLWCIHYGPRDYIRRRGGDLTVYVDSQDYTIKKVLRGQ